MGKKVESRVLSRALGALALLITLTAASAAAQGSGRLGSSGDVALGAERMFGFLSTSYTSEEMGIEDTVSFTQFSLLSGGSASPYAAPRIALDGFVADSVSLGGTFGLATLSMENEITGMGVSMTQEGNSLLAIVVGGRVGYAFMFNDTVGLWPHLGVTYFTASSEDPDGDESSNDGLALSVDAMLAITPVPHLGFSIGPVLDLGLTGSSESTDAGSGISVSSDNTITDWGIQAGLFGWL